MARRNTNATINENITTTATDEASTRALKIDGQAVIAEITVRKNKDAKPVNLTARIDFSGISESQILLWAARTKIIDLQRALRLCDQTFIEDLARRGPIERRATEAGTGFVDPARAKQQILDRAAGMTPEERAELIRALQADM